MTKRAVLIGINYEGAPMDNPLQGCVNDVINMRELLMNKYGFPEENLRVLIDGQNDDSLPLPTARNIMDAMSAAVDESQDGDVLFFHYSGHGGQQDDANGEEGDGMDEFLVSHDAVPITDDFLKSLLARLSDGVIFTFIADCCHSGTMLDQPVQDIEITGEKSTTEGDAYVAEAPVAGARKLAPEQVLGFISNTHGSAATFMAANPFVPNELADQLGEGTTSRDWLSSAIGFVEEQTVLAASGEQGPPPEITVDHCVLISGCMDNQTSADANINNSFNGALTFAICESLKGAERSPSYMEVVRLTRDWLASNQYTQNPTLSCADGKADLPFICEAIA